MSLFKSLIPVLTCALLVSGCADDQEGAGGRGRPPMTVAAERAALSDYTPQLTALGTVTPLQTVDVRPRVDGQIIEVLFREGQTVARGQTLFRLDDRAVRADLARQRAELASARATAARAAADLRRSEALVGKGFISRALLDEKRADAGTASAAIAGAQAAISSAETQLSYLTVRAPVSGRTGEINYRLGATVRPADTLPLVTINQLAPIAVRFAVPPAQIQPLRDKLAAAPVPITARSRGDGAGSGGQRLASGRLTFLDNNVDAGNGALAAKAEFANQGEELWPGSIVDLDVPLGASQPRISLPESAIQAGPDFSYVWTVGSDGSVGLTKVTIAGRAGGRAFLAAGVEPGVQVVTDALAKLKPGDKVRVRGARAAPVQSAARASAATSG